MKPERVAYPWEERMLRRIWEQFVAGETDSLVIEEVPG